MSKKQEFINYVEALIEKNNDVPMNDDAKVYWDNFKNKDEIEKPLFTDNGKLILKHLQQHEEVTSWKARDIAEDLFISSRTVSGSIRKLVNDGYVEKISQDPVIYAITDKGKNTEII